MVVSVFGVSLDVGGLRFLTQIVKLIFSFKIDSFKVDLKKAAQHCNKKWLEYRFRHHQEPFQDIVLHEGSSNHPELSITQQAVHLHVSILDFAAYCKYKKRMRFEPNMQHVLGTVMTIVQSWIAFLETVAEKDEVEQLKAFSTVIAKAKEGGEES